jgi:hypothetical protein
VPLSSAVGVVNDTMICCIDARDDVIAFNHREHSNTCVEIAVFFKERGSKRLLVGSHFRCNDCLTLCM